MAFGKQQQPIESAVELQDENSGTSDFFSLERERERSVSLGNLSQSPEDNKKLCKKKNNNKQTTKNMMKQTERGLFFSERRKFVMCYSLSF